MIADYDSFVNPLNCRG